MFDPLAELAGLLDHDAQIMLSLAIQFAEFRKALARSAPDLSSLDLSAERARVQLLHMAYLLRHLALDLPSYRTLLPVGTPPT